MKDHFDIRIKGQLPEEWTDWFENLEISFDGENTILTGYITDQAALHGLLNRIRDLNLKLISVNPENEKNNYGSSGK